MMGLIRVLPAAFCCLFITLAAGTTAMAGEDAEESVDTLVDGLLRRKHQILSASFTYEYGVLLKVPELNLPREWNPERHDRGYLTIVGAEWMCRRTESSEKEIRRTTYSAVHSSGRKSPEADVSHAIELTAPQKTLQEISEEQFWYQVAMAGVVPWDELLAYLDTNRDAAEYRGPTEIEGEETHLIELSIPWSASDIVHEFNPALAPEEEKENADFVLARFYVLPEFGYALRRLDYCSTDGEMGNRFESRNFQEVAPGIHFPMEYYVIRNYEGFGLNSGYMVDQFQINKVERVNEPAPADEFEVNLPVGTLVQNYAGEIPLVFNTTGPVALSELDEAISSGKTDVSIAPSGSPLRSIIVLANIGILILLVIIIMVRQKWANSSQNDR